MISTWVLFILYVGGLTNNASSTAAAMTKIEGFKTENECLINKISFDANSFYLTQCLEIKRGKQ